MSELIAVGAVLPDKTLLVRCVHQRLGPRMESYRTERGRNRSTATTVDDSFTLSFPDRNKSVGTCLRSLDVYHGGTSGRWGDGIYSSIRG